LETQYFLCNTTEKNGTIATKEAPTAVVDPETKPVPPRTAIDPESKQVYKLKSLKEDQDQSSIGENDKKKSDETAENNEKNLKKNIRNKEPGSEYMYKYNSVQYVVRYIYGYNMDQGRKCITLYNT